MEVWLYDAHILGCSADPDILVFEDAKPTVLFVVDGDYFVADEVADNFMVLAGTFAFVER